jgi:hypothetical protein
VEELRAFILSLLITLASRGGEYVVSVTLQHVMEGVVEIVIMS